MLLIGLSTILTLSLQPADGGVSAAEAASQPTGEAWIVRVREPDGDDVVDRPGPEGPLYAAGAVSTDTKLPVGYPRPTPPGAIEIKHYPSVRQAEVSGSNSLLASQRGFMPLFNHIESNGIAMTAPVEMRYADDDDDGTTDRWTMAFLYHTTDDGPTGDDGRVVVIDTEPITVVSLGVRGRRSPESTREMAGELEQWLAENADEWRAAGELRVLGYNGPYVPTRDRWWEVQLPVAPVREDASPASADEPKRADPAEASETI
ncbi:MAG: heme-binding protein [Phycisphaerales bacterium]